MGSIDDAVPFFGRNFNRIYPLIMVVYTILVAGNFFGYLFEIFGSWKRFKFWTEEEEDTNGFDPSGVMILQKGKTLVYLDGYLFFLLHSPHMLFFFQYRLILRDFSTVFLLEIIF